MMKLSLMNKVCQTVTDEYDCPLAETILENWTYDLGFVKFIRASANFICLLKIDGKNHFVRFNEISERKPHVIEDEIKLLHYLADNGISVAKPVASKNGNYVETVETKLGTYVAVVFEGVAGEHIDLEEMSENQIQQWGAALGKLHKMLRNYPLTEAENRPSWEDLLDFAVEQIKPDEVMLQRELNEVRSELSSLPQTEDNYGLIHFDFEQDNLLWSGDKLTMIDFDDSAKLWYAADIAYGLRDMFKPKPVDTSNKDFQTFMRGYRSHTSIEDWAIDSLPLMVRLHRLLFIARLRRSTDIVDFTSTLAWVPGLSEKLNNNIQALIDDIDRGQILVR